MNSQLSSQFFFILKPLSHSSPHPRLAECTSWWEQRGRRAIAREPNGSRCGCRGQLPRGRQGCACGSYCPSAKGACSQAGENRVHGRSHQTAGGGDPQKDQVSGQEVETDEKSYVEWSKFLATRRRLFLFCSESGRLMTFDYILMYHYCILTYFSGHYTSILMMRDYFSWSCQTT